jgi:uncharacterized protein YjbI with pentapeptide repeats
MSESENSFVQGIREHKVRAAIAVLAIVAAFAILLWAVIPSITPAWTGFGSANASDGGMITNRTLWEWLELLLIPAALLLGAWWVSHPRKELDVGRSSAEAFSKSQLEAIDSQHQEKRIQIYYDTMTELLLKHGLREASRNDEVRRVARAQTMTVLWGLNSERRGALTRFLYESQLIQHPDPIISLAGANLSSANLSGVDLSDADLRQARLTAANLADARLHRTDLAGADLTGADLQGAVPTKPPVGASRWVPPNLSRANLNEAVLREANLAETNLTEASLRGTRLDQADLHKAILRGADLHGAQLKDANLSEANLDEADMSEANLVKAKFTSAILTKATFKRATMRGVDAWQANFKDADLSGADLSEARLAMCFLFNSNLRGANLTGANLRGANLSRADLTGAKLERADLRGAYLSGAIVTSEELAPALSLEGATMPDNQRVQISLGTDGKSNGSRGLPYPVATNESENS